MPRSGLYARPRALRGADPSRAESARLPHREALDDPGSISAVAQRAATGLQPVDQPRSGHRLRRVVRPRRRPATVALRAGAAGQRRPGQKKDRFEQLLGGEGSASGAPATSVGAGPVAVGGFDEPVQAGEPDERIGPGHLEEPATPARAPDNGALEARVAALEADLAALRAQLADLLN